MKIRVDSLTSFKVEAAVQRNFETFLINGHLLYGFVSFHLLFSLRLCQIIIFIPILFLLFLAVLGLGCCSGCSPVVAGRGCSLVVVHRLSLQWLLAAEHKL